ncbi:serine hydrolase domain-containing protein [Cryobacterium psychrophilum]|uniref:Class A beta-lactamase-related serine hydrolase n=1 Tax=Cryobacterium psychrophilum TaxID=41988 RepID=A0A4Y8KQT1_9MICO|nr:serine hydrolase domain-containing protein [Cryobacterium psychrophilum]TDW28457.1 CubicO group peptidase (beta-lactamase class C family) [Cryobacterium psychrophilum]TFD80549.1 class A beta-lactamase-related serine hydrolase [Cryobacterium psychrophilum]
MPAVYDEVDEVFAEHHARGSAPSLAWGTFDRSGLVRFGSAGLGQDGTVPGSNTAYRIASCTKSFTAATVLALRDAGKLSLDDPVTRFVPAFACVPLPSVDAPVPTVRMLLTMSAGLPTDDPWADRQEALSVEAFDSLLQRGLTFESIPGTRFAYSNLGFALLGRVIEQASGRGYRDVVNELFLEPLRLTGTGWDASVSASGGVAVGTRWLDTDWHALPFSSPGAFSPIGGLFSTVTDLSRWAAWLAAAHDATGVEEPNSPLSRASRREMQQAYRFVPTLPQHPTGYGFGLFVEQYARTGTVVSHSGGYPGFSAHMRWSTTGGHGIVAFGNATHSRLSVATTQAFDLLHAAATPPPVTVLPATRAAQRSLNDLIRQWSDDSARAIFAPNVALDDYFDRRQAALARAVERVGGLDPAPSSTDDPGRVLDAGELSNGPAHLVWHVPGRAGRLRVEIRLTPEHPPRVQTLTIAADLVQPR